MQKQTPRGSQESIAAIDGYKSIDHYHKDVVEPLVEKLMAVNPEEAAKQIQITVKTQLDMYKERITDLEKLVYAQGAKIEVLEKHLQTNA